MKKYLVFQCSKCHEYTYAYLGQKGKKCPRCGRYHQIERIQGEIVSNITNAMIKVKEKQNLILNGETPTFKSSMLEVVFKNNFEKIGNCKVITHKNGDLEEFINKIHNFQKIEQINQEIGFPEYILNLISEDLDVTPYQRNKLIEKVKSLPYFIEFENGNVYLKF